MTFLSKKIHLLGRSISVGKVLLGIGTLGVVAAAAHYKYLYPPVVKEAARIVTKLEPPELSSDHPSMLSGRFENKAGQPVRVKMGKFLIVKQPDPQHQGQPPQVMGGGLIGPYASEFQHMIDTRNLPPGQYHVVVSDSIT